MTEKRRAKSPLHKNIKPVLSPDLDSPLLLCLGRFLSSEKVSALKVSQLINQLKV